MRRLFENMDDNNQRRKHNYKKHDTIADKKYMIEDVHYMMQYHLHI